MFGKVIVLWNLFNGLVRLLPELERQLKATVEASEKESEALRVGTSVD